MNYEKTPVRKIVIKQKTVKKEEGCKVIFDREMSDSKIAIKQFKIDIKTRKRMIKNHKLLIKAAKLKYKANKIGR